MAFPGNFPPPRNSSSIRYSISSGKNSRGNNRREYFRSVNRRSRDTSNLEYPKRARSRTALECILQTRWNALVCTCNTHVVLELPSEEGKMVSNGKIPSVLFHLEMARIVFQLHREIFSPRGKKKRRRRKKKKRQFTFLE